MKRDAFQLHKNRTISFANDQALKGDPTIVGTLQPCESVFFWGGGKAGSTTLAALLKNDKHGEWDENGQFIPLGKEVCWSFKGGHARWLYLIDQKCSSGGHKFALDACPRYTSDSHAQTILDQYPDAKFLMLIRDPVDRLVSHLNDQHGWRGRRRSLPDGFIDGAARRLLQQRSSLTVQLSMFGQNLQSLLQVVRDPRQVLVIQTDSMKRNAQQVVDDVMHHIGGSKKLVDTIHANNGKQKDGYEYQTISNETRLEFQNIFDADVKLLEALLSKTFPWSWTSTKATDANWLTAYVPLTLSELS
jgi:hypothetical protein